MEAKVIVHPSAISRYSEMTWDYTYQNLWYKYLLNEEEITSMKDQITELFSSIDPESFAIEANEHFHVLCIKAHEFMMQKEMGKRKLLSVMADAMDELMSLHPPVVVQLSGNSG